jgi:hypothetical protein
MKRYSTKRYIVQKWYMLQTGTLQNDTVIKRYSNETVRYKTVIAIMVCYITVHYSWLLLRICARSKKDCHLHML